MNPRSSLRRPGEERRSVAPSTPASNPATGAPQRTKAATSPALLYFCPPFRCWLGVSACTAIKLREKLPPAASRVAEDPSAEGEGPVYRFLRAHGRRLSPCVTCPGVVELRARRKTPAPRRVET